MQPSELWRRGVVMPLNSEAIEQISAWDVDESTAVEFLPISSDALFYELWEIELFAEINRQCGSLIDDYEEEWLRQEQLPASACAVVALLRQHRSGAVGEFLNQLSALISKAADTKLPLYFVC